MSLSKIYTRAKLEDLLRVLVNQIAPDKLQDLSLLDIINLSTLDVVEMLNGASAPDYGETTEVSLKDAPTSVKNTIDISSYKIDRVTKLIDDNAGLIIPVGEYEFENLENIAQKQDNVFYYQFGETIYTYKGTGVTTLGTVTMYYYRNPELLSDDADFIDVKDKFVPLIVAKAKNLIYEQLKIAPPESLTSLIEQKTAEIRKINLEERQDIESRK